MLPLLRCLFAHLLILQYADHHQHLISSSLYYSGPVHKISSQSVHNFLSNVVHRQINKQTDRQTNQRYQKHNLLCQGGNYIKSICTHQDITLSIYRITFICKSGMPSWIRIKVDININRLMFIYNCITFYPGICCTSKDSITVSKSL